jgi:hypothetical protein
MVAAVLDEVPGVHRLPVERAGGGHHHPNPLVLPSLFRAPGAVELLLHAPLESVVTIAASQRE